MKHTKVAVRNTHPARLVWHALLVGLTLMSVLGADPALARRGKGGMPPGVQLKPMAPAPALIDPALLPPPAIKPILHPGRHGSKPRGAAR